MRTTLKIVLPLIVSVATVSLLFAAYRVQTEKRILRNDLSHRAEILGESLQESVEPLFDRVPDKSMQRLVERFAQREHLKGVAIYDANGTALAITSSIALQLQSRPIAAILAANRDTGYGKFLRVDQIPMHIYALPLRHHGQTVGTLVVMHDTSYVDTQISHTLRDSLLHAIIQTLLITAIALVLVRWAFTGALTRTANWLRMLRTGQSHAAPDLAQGEIFDQINQEVTHLAHDLSVARATAEEESRLRTSVRTKLQDKLLFVVSNREPYMRRLE
jgi:trehalose 6-phosphate synthase